MKIRPLFQLETRSYRTYHGGKLLERFLGKENPKDSDQPEDWVSSFISVVNSSDPLEGITRVLVDGEEKLITEVVTPECFGPGRTQSGVLIKLLDAGERLGIQVHPTPDYSRKYFGTNYGKTECWHILETDDQKDAAVYVGFREGITRQLWEQWYREQNVEKMLSAMHRFQVKPGDTVLVTAGTPHCIGAGCFLLEIQEPTDYTMRVETTLVSGLKLTPMQIHLGLGDQAMMDCFAYESLTPSQAEERFFLKPRPQNDSGSHICLVSHEDTSCFALDRIIGGNTTIHPDSFVTLVALKDGQVVIGDEEYTVKASNKIFVPYDCGDITIVDAEVLVCYPPKLP